MKDSLNPIQGVRSAIDGYATFDNPKIKVAIRNLLEALDIDISNAGYIPSLNVVNSMDELDNNIEQDILELEASVAIEAQDKEEVIGAITPSEPEDIELAEVFEDEADDDEDDDDDIDELADEDDDD